MAMGSKNKGDAAKSEVRLGMPADFRIGEVTDVHRQFGEALDASQVVLDGSAVERIDTAALQLLVVFQREVQKRGNQMNWAGVSAPLHDAAGQLGVTQILALPAKQPA
jgi:phospholipid transport system transporter-binding protein